MKIHIKLITKIIIVSCLINASCTESFLELDNPNELTNYSYWRTGAELEAGLATVYKAFSEDANWSYWQRTNVQLVEGRTENFTVSRDVLNRHQISIFTNTPDNLASQRIYIGCYTGIFRANQVISNSKGIFDIEQYIINQYVAEAKFCRALNYFNLVNEFGQVPIVLKPAATQGDFYVEKSDVDSVWKQIISDLKEAIPYLPYSYPDNQKGRATKGAATAYLGKAYLYTQEWDSAVFAFQEILNNEDSYGYNLMPEYADNFTGMYENNQESVFEIQYSRLRSPVYGGPAATSTVIAQECAPFEKGGWQELRPTPVLLYALIKEKTQNGDFDPRAITTLAWSYPGCIYYQSVFDSLWAKNEIHLRKNQNWWNENEGDRRSGLNEHAMRYADVLLMLAEAYTMQNKIPEAAILVHRIRERADLTDISTTMAAWDREKMMEEIRHQRNIEFAREMIHWFDLRRWGILEETIIEAGREGYQNFEEKYLYYPIPSEEIRNNPAIIQNESWR